MCEVCYKKLLEGSNQNQKKSERSRNNVIDKFKYSVGGNHMYRCATVKATYYINFDYGDVDLYIFNFIEVDEEGEPILTKLAGRTDKDKTMEGKATTKRE